MTREPALYDVVRLTVDLPEEGLLAGMVGAIVDVFDSPTRAFEVEFADPDGRTIAELALLPGQIELIPASGD